MQEFERDFGKLEANILERDFKKLEGNISRLKKIEKELGQLNTDGFESRRESILIKLKYPNRVDEVEEEFSTLKRDIKRGKEAGQISNFIKDLENGIKNLTKKDSGVYIDDINELIEKIKEKPTKDLLDTIKKLLEEKQQLLDRRNELVSEFDDIKNRMGELSKRAAVGEISEQSFRDIKDELDIRKIEIQDELGDIDYKLYKEEYEKPVF